MMWYMFICARFFNYCINTILLHVKLICKVAIPKL
jgi:hypothetical protein